MLNSEMKKTIEMKNIKIKVKEDNIWQRKVLKENEGMVLKGTHVWDWFPLCRRGVTTFIVMGKKNQENDSGLEGS